MAYLSNIDFKIERLSTKEKSEIGVFISHQGSDQGILDELIPYLSDDVNVLSDRMLNADTNNFSERLNELIMNSTALIVAAKVLTPWIMYEIGRARALNKPIYVYKGKREAFLQDAIYVDDLAILKNMVKKHSLFSDLYVQETADLTKEQFDSEVLPNLSCVRLKISIPGLKNIPSMAYQFGMIIPSLAKTLVDNASCCMKNGEELVDAMCQCYDKDGFCPLLMPCQEKIAMVVLNKTYNGTLSNDSVIQYLIPVHNKIGVTFKCYVDIVDFTYHEQVIKALEAAGVVEANTSSSGANDRIYFTLPKRPVSGLFKALEPEGFYNNYICPGGVL